MSCAMRCAPMIALLVLAVAAAPAAAPAAGRPDQARLRLSALRPVVVRGAGFAPHERVRVRLRYGRHHVSRTLHARRSGRFRMDFPASAAPPPCSPFVVTARGAAGERASLVHHPPLCDRP